jgi:hypothetical protein
MDIPITEIGAGGILAIVMVKMVFDFIKSAKNKNNEYVLKSEFEKHKDSVQYRDTCAEIVKRIDNGFEDIRKDFNEVKDLIRNGGK